MCICVLGRTQNVVSSEKKSCTVCFDPNSKQDIVKTFRRPPRSSGCPIPCPPRDPCRKKSRGNFPTFQRLLFCKRGSSVTPPAASPTAAAADSARLSAPSFCQARGSREQPEWGGGGEGRGAPASTLCARPGPGSRLRVLLLPAFRRSKEPKGGAWRWAWPRQGGHFRRAFLALPIGCP